MGIVAEGLEIEAAFATTQLAAQRREARPVDASRAQEKTVGHYAAARLRVARGGFGRRARLVFRMDLSATFTVMESGRSSSLSLAFFWIFCSLRIAGRALMILQVSSLSVWLTTSSRREAL